MRKPKDCPQSTWRMAKEYIKRRVSVYIHNNDENGSWVWSVDVDENHGFWLDAFKTKNEAIIFCRNNKLPWKAGNKANRSFYY